MRRCAVIWVVWLTAFAGCATVRVGNTRPQPEALADYYVCCCVGDPVFPSLCQDLGWPCDGVNFMEVEGLVGEE